MSSIQNTSNDGLYLCFVTNKWKKMGGIAQLPPPVDVESKRILKKTAEAHRYLSEFKGIAANIISTSCKLAQSKAGMATLRRRKYYS